MAGTAFQTCPQNQQFVFADVRREALDPNDLGTSECDRSSLVDSHDVNFCELLKNDSAFQQDAAWRSARNCRNYDKRSKATAEALKKARDGGGPTFVECFTYRMSDHTTADDATRYRTKEEVEAWKPKDPLLRLKLFMEKNRLWTEKYQK